MSKTSRDKDAAARILRQAVVQTRPVPLADRAVRRRAGRTGRVEDRGRVDGAAG
ncbi:hypothetical protein [Streptosporangium sp. NPDC002524]|uniref:hypothetical protein n=1 Tax=Streptosporangium sp. NPDC002524 TaxID=3154537 RepID=UPI00331D27F2